MIPVSTVPVVKRYLADQLMDAYVGKVAPGFPLLVVYDIPGMHRPSDIIAVGKVPHRSVSGLAMVGSGGRGWLKEDYEIELVVDVFRPGESLQIQAYERAWELMSIAESVVRDDPSLGGNVISARPSRSSDSSEWEKDHKGWIVTVVTHVTVLAQI